jgi:hypothetical protein
MNYCEWKEDDLDCGCWNTACGEAFVLNGDLPSDNKMKFCCYCGKPLKEIPYKEQEG